MDFNVVPPLSVYLQVFDVSLLPHFCLYVVFPEAEAALKPLTLILMDHASVAVALQTSAYRTLHVWLLYFDASSVISQARAFAAVPGNRFPCNSC